MYKFLVFVAFTIMVSLPSCKKEENVKESKKGLVTPIGTPDGNAVTKAIDAAGGNISSEDGKIKVSIPAGALSAPTTISIQPITNHTPGGVKKAYRLTPHGTQFAKPVTITFTYNDVDIINTVPELLHIAYQNSEGVWQAITGAQVNRNNKTVSVTTTHFSDWSLFEAFRIIPTEGTVQTGRNLSLKVVYNYIEDIDDLVVPLTETPLGDQRELAGKHIIEWNLAGEGKLDFLSNVATYTAPSSIPAINPVTITVKLKLPKVGQFTDFTLVGYITVIADEYIQLTAGAGPAAGTIALTSVPQAIYDISENRTYITAYIEPGTTQDNRRVEIVFPGKLTTGSYTWDRMNNIGVTYTVRPNGGSINTVYNAFYHVANPPTWYNSSGSIKITRYGKVGEYIEGEFSIDKSGYEDGGKTITTLNSKFLVKFSGDTP